MSAIQVVCVVGVVMVMVFVWRNMPGRVRARRLNALFEVLLLQGSGSELRTTLEEMGVYPHDGGGYFNPFPLRDLRLDRMIRVIGFLFGETTTPEERGSLTRSVVSWFDGDRKVLQRIANKADSCHPVGHNEVAELIRRALELRAESELAYRVRRLKEPFIPAKQPEEL